MSQVENGVRALRAAADSGELGDMAASFDLSMVTLFGSSRTSPGTANDIDIAYLASEEVTRTSHLNILDQLVQLTGCNDIDLMALHSATPVALFTGIVQSDLLYEVSQHFFTTQQVRAFGLFRDTEHFRKIGIQAWAA